MIIQSSAVVFGTFHFDKSSNIAKNSEEILEGMSLRQGTAYLNKAVPYFISPFLMIFSK